jgi:hypothetical protein
MYIGATGWQQAAAKQARADVTQRTQADMNPIQTRPWIGMEARGSGHVSPSPPDDPPTGAIALALAGPQNRPGVQLWWYTGTRRGVYLQ